MGAVCKLLRKSPGLIQRFGYSVIPFKYRYDSIYRKTSDFLSKSEWWSREKLRSYQLEELNKMVHQAYKNIPYYTRVFDKRGLKPNDITTINDLKKLPILTKKEILENGENLINKSLYNELKSLNRITEMKSSGSSGIALHFVANKDLYGKEAAFIERAYLNHDSSLYKDKSIWIRRFVPNLNEPFHFYDYELKRMYMSAYHISDETIHEYVDIINKSKAPLIVAYASSAYILALFIQKHNLKLNHVTAIHTASEKLVNEWRIKIEEVLNIPVKEHYGMAEKSCLFHKCSESNLYHENLEYGVTEIDDDGSVIATGFINQLMPFIRYKPRDIVTENTGNKQCECGRGLPLTIEEVTGRVDDIIMTKDGRLLPPTNFYSMMDKIKNVEMFQMTQHELDKIEVDVVLSDSRKKDYIIEQIKKGFKERLGECEIDLSIVDKITRSETTGKIRCIRTKLKQSV
jgi:phenylacetate-CoA ligase